MENKETKIQEDEVQTVGEMLRNARLKRGATIADVAQELCIRKSYVTAIENMDYANIPPVPYGVGFIRSYAQYLGLNSDRVISSYRQFMTEENEGKKTVKEDSVETSKPRFKHIFIGLCGLAALFIIWSVMPVSEQVEEFREDQLGVVPEPVIVDNDADAELMSQLRAEDVKDGEQITFDENADGEEISAAEEIYSEDGEDFGATADTASADENVAENVADSTTMKIVITGPTWLELKQGKNVLIAGRVYDSGFEYVVPNEKGLRVTVGRPHNVKFLVGEEELPVVSVMKRKNISLDEFIPQESQE